MKVDQSINLAEAAGAAPGPESPRSNEFGDEPKIDLARTDSHEGFQDGVRQAEAITQSWTKGSLRTMFAL